MGNEIQTGERRSKTLGSKVKYAVYSKAATHSGCCGVFPRSV